MAGTWWSWSDWQSASGRRWQDWWADNGWGWASSWGEANAQQEQQQTAVAAPDRAGAGERADAETQDEEAAGRRTMPATAAELDPPGAEALDLCVAGAAPVGNDDAEAGQASSTAPWAAVAARAASSCAPPQTPAPAPPPQTPAPPPPVAEGQVIFAITDFQTLEPGYHWSRHNLALKNIRQWVWDGDLPAVADFSNHGELFPHQLVEKPGPDIEFDLTKDQVPWRWQEMIAQLDADSMEFVVNGASGTSGGVVGCSFCRAHNSYDHKMSYLHKKQRDERMHFLVRRADGTGVRLHPQKTKTRSTLTTSIRTHSPCPRRVVALARAMGRALSNITRCLA